MQLGSSAAPGVARRVVATSKLGRYDWYRLLDPIGLDDPILTLPGVDGMTVHESLVRARPDLFRVEAVVAPPGVARSVDHYFETVSVDDRLRQYQQETVVAVHGKQGAVLAWDMGLGKTWASAEIIRLSGLAPVLVCGPRIARSAWCGPRSDLYRHYGIDVQRIEGRLSASGDHTFDPQGWYFLHYDILKAWLGQLLMRLRPRAVVFDEAHVLGNIKTQRGHAARQVARLRPVELRLPLTGTPIVNRLVDLHAPLDLALPDSFGNKLSFGERYCGATRGAYGWEYDGQSNLDELDKRTAGLLFRKTRREVLTDLPPITRQTVEIDADESDQTLLKRYREVQRDVRRAMRDMGKELGKLGGEHLTRFTLLCSTLSKMKAGAVSEVVANALTSHDKVVVFFWYKDSARKLSASTALRAAAGPDTAFFLATGDESADKRIGEAAHFNEFQGKAVFIATIAACGLALNDLACASCAIFGDLYWVPSMLLQAEARIWRSGQAHHVQALYVVARNTVDEAMIQALIAKSQEAEVAGEGEESALAQMLAENEARQGMDRDALEALVSSIIDLEHVEET